MSGYQLGRDAVDGYVWLDHPDVVLSGGPSHSREARRDDPPYEKPRHPLGFTPNLRECEKCPPDGCDLSCSWPTEAEPLLWEGDES